MVLSKEEEKETISYSATVVERGLPAKLCTMGKQLHEGNLPLEGESRMMTTVEIRPVQAGDLPLDGSSLEIILSSKEVSQSSCKWNNKADIEDGSSRHNASDAGRCLSSILMIAGKSLIFWSLVIGIFTSVAVFTIIYTTQVYKEPDYRETIEEFKGWVLSNNYSSSQDMSDTSSPQFQALQFMTLGHYDIPTTTEQENRWKERYALSVFYYATNGPKWKDQFEFHESKLPTCGWFQLRTVYGNDDGGLTEFGASCSSDNVDAVRLANQGLQGTIPTEIALLENLRILELQHNQIRGTLPSEMQHLTNLREFDCISCKRLSGSLPGWIGKLTMMKSLGLTKNKFEGSFPSNFGALTGLLNLAIDNNFLTGDLSVLKSMRSLRNVYLEGNNFTGTIGETLFENLNDLETLDLSDNNIRGGVPINLFYKTKLKILDLHDNLFNEFPDAIMEIQDTNLEFLAIHGNPIENDFFPGTVKFLSNLAHLDITSTKIRGEMPNFLGDLTKLTYLFLADTSFDQGPIPESYKKLTNLRDFSVKDSARNGTIPSWFSTFSNLILLDLDSNELTGPLPEVLPENLNFLLVNRNSLTGTIPSSLINSALQILWMDHNKISGDLDPLCASVNLQSLSSDCNGTFPLVVCDCCDICCDASSDVLCHDRDRLAQYDPEWQDHYNRHQFYDFRVDHNITRL